MNPAIDRIPEMILDEDDEQTLMGLTPHSQVVRIPAWVRDFNSFRRWTASKDFPQFGRISWFAGELEIDLNAENISFHSSVKACLGGNLFLIVSREDLGEMFGDGLRLVHEPSELNCEPDLSFCSWEAFESGRVSYQEKSNDPTARIELRGVPDLVVEIVSPSSIAKDKRKLRRAYFAAGIPEYWLIDARKQEIDFRILTPGRGGYVEATPDAEGYQTSTVFRRGFRLIRTRNRVGHWKYHLEARP